MTRQVQPKSVPSPVHPCFCFEIARTDHGVAKQPHPPHTSLIFPLIPFKCCLVSWSFFFSVFQWSQANLVSDVWAGLDTVPCITQVALALQRIVPSVNWWQLVQDVSSLERFHDCLGVGAISHPLVLSEKFHTHHSMFLFTEPTMILISEDSEDSRFTRQSCSGFERPVFPGYPCGLCQSALRLGALGVDTSNCQDS